MGQIAEDYVSFETATLLKEKGFDIPLNYFYNSDGRKGYAISYNWNQTLGDFPAYSCPTLQMAMKWLREVHNIHIALVPYVTKDKKVVYGYQVSILMTVIPLSRAYNSYEEAGEAAVRDCLENLI